MKKFCRYQEVKTGHWINYNKAQKKHLKIKGFSKDYKQTKIFVPPPTSRLEFREKSSGRFLNKYKTLHKKITPELYIDNIRKGKILPREYSETELKIIIGKYKDIAKIKYKGGGIELPPRHPGAEFLEKMINENRKRSYKTLKQVIVNSFVDYKKLDKTHLSNERKLRIKANMLNFILDLPREDQKNLTVEQLQNIYENALLEIKENESQSRIPF